MLPVPSILMLSIWLFPKPSFWVIVWKICPSNRVKSKQMLIGLDLGKRRVQAFKQGFFFVDCQHDRAPLGTKHEIAEQLNDGSPV